MVVVSLVISSSAVDFLERLVSKITCYAVASPTLVSPGAATDGVTLFFKVTTFLIIVLSIAMTFLISLPTPCHVPYPRKFSPQKFNFIRLSRPWMVSPGAFHPPSDATAVVPSGIWNCTYQLNFIQCQLYSVLTMMVLAVIYLGHLKNLNAT